MQAPGLAAEVEIAPHAPAVTQGEMVEKACRLLGVKPQIAVASPLMMRIGGLFSSGAREMVEMMYEFTEPFIVDSDRMQRAFGLTPTSADAGIERTVKWYKEHEGKR